MLTRIQARNYRCLKHVDQRLSHFDIMVGGNGVGKSTFLDVISLVGEIVSQPRDSLNAALRKRSTSLSQLLFDSETELFEIAVEATIPEPISRMVDQLGPDSVVRFQVQIGHSSNSPGKVGILNEKLMIRRHGTTGAWTHPESKRQDGTKPVLRSGSIMEADGFSVVDDFHQAFTVVSRNEGLTIFTYENPPEPGKVGFTQFHLAPGSVGFANLPEDRGQFPVATWFRRYLAESISVLTLEPEKLKRPVGIANTHSDGMLNIPELVSILSADNPNGFSDWISHLRIALPDLHTISVAERPEDRQRYIVTQYADDRHVPSWLLSDGTLRLIGLTLPAYALDDGRVFLIEEPENCIHPLAIEVVMQSLSSMYESQVFVTTHSPAILSLAEPENILCFSKSVEEGTSIVRGSDHPRLSDWKKSVDLGTLLASGILG